MFFNKKSLFSWIKVNIPYIFVLYVSSSLSYLRSWCFLCCISSILTLVFVMEQSWHIRRLHVKHIYNFYFWCSSQREPMHSWFSSTKLKEEQKKDLVPLLILEIEEGEFCCEIILESKRAISVELSSLNSVWDRIFLMWDFLDWE